MKDVLLTTTENLSGWEILEYKQPVFSNVVVGGGFLSDIGAAFSDIFGSRSESYEKRLLAINQKALAILKLRARELGANCIVGLRIDSDQISGKNSQLFMITAYGTAVIAKNSNSQAIINSGREIDVDSVKDRAKLLRLISNLNDSNLKVSYDDLELISESRMPVFKDYILNRLKNILANTNADTTEGKRALDLYTKYFALIDNDAVVNLLYEAILTKPAFTVIDGIVSIIIANDLVNYNEIKKLLLSGSLEIKKQALKILKADKPYYTSNDIIEINDVIQILENAFPILGTTGSKKGFLSSNEKEVWICQCGKNNTPDQSYCNGCDNNIYGFKESEVKQSTIMDQLKRKAIAISELISN